MQLRWLFPCLWFTSQRLVSHMLKYGVRCCLTLGLRYPMSQPAHQQDAPPVWRCIIVAVAGAPGVEVGTRLQRHPKVSRSAAESNEALRGHSGNRKGHAFNRERSPHSLAVMIKIAVPEAVTQNHRLRVLLLIRRA